MAKSLKTNYLLSMLNTVSGVLFPVLTFPYAARILFADGIGQVNFYQSIIAYFTLFACLGIPAYATRLIAQVKNEPQRLSHVTFEILTLNGILTLIAYGGALIVAMTVDKVHTNLPLFAVLSLSIAITSMGCEWFYQGREDFKYITMRGLAVKTVSAAFLFLVVKDQTDIIWYGLYTVVGSVGGNIFNILRLRRFISKKHISKSDFRPFRHLKGAVKIFAIYAITTLYLELNTVLLGFIDDNATVGYYTGANKIMRITLTLVTTLGVVMLPRMSQHIKEGNHVKFKELAQKSYEFALVLSIPLSIGVAVISPILIPIFCGDSYDPAIPTLSIMAPANIFIALANVISVQILLPQEHENKILKATMMGLVTSVIVASSLIPLLHQNGAAISLLLTEMAVTISAACFGRRYISLNYINRRIIVRIASALAMGVVVYFTSQLFTSLALNLVVGIASGVVVYMSLLIALRDPFAKEAFTFARRLLHI